MCIQAQVTSTCSYVTRPVIAVVAWQLTRDFRCQNRDTIQGASQRDSSAYVPTLKQAV
jgi:hypothetical protein